MPAPVSAPAAISRILFATDFSSHSESAMPHAVAEARRYGAKLFVTHVLPHEPRLAVPFDVLPGVYDEARHAAEVAFRRLENSGVLEGIPHECLMPTGELWPTLCQTAGKHKIDLIVLGTRGRGGVAKLLMGSVAEDVCRKAACAVLTIGPRADPPAACVRVVVFPTDLARDSEQALSHAQARVCRGDSRLVLVHALHPEMIAPDTPRELLIRKATERLMALSPQGAEWPPETEIVVDFGPAADLILKVADQRKADLIIMGVHAKGALRESPHLPWSTAHRVICHAHCPVLTVRG